MKWEPIGSWFARSLATSIVGLGTWACVGGPPPCSPSGFRAGTSMTAPADLHIVCPTKDAWVFDGYCYENQAVCERARRQKIESQGRAPRRGATEVGSAAACSE